MNDCSKCRILVRELEKRMELHVRYQKEALDKAEREMAVKLSREWEGRLKLLSTLAALGGGIIGIAAAYLLK